MNSFVISGSPVHYGESIGRLSLDGAFQLRLTEQSFTDRCRAIPAGTPLLGVRMQAIQAWTTG
jgi:hypothetical protein